VGYVRIPDNSLLDILVFIYELSMSVWMNGELYVLALRIDFAMVCASTLRYWKFARKLLVQTIVFLSFDRVGFICIRGCIREPICFPNNNTVELRLNVNKYLLKLSSNG